MKANNDGKQINNGLIDSEHIYEIKLGYLIIGLYKLTIKIKSFIAN